MPTKGRNKVQGPIRGPQNVVVSEMLRGGG